MHGNAKDLTGKQFGRWAVIRRVENSATGLICYLCRCQCGSEKVVYAGNLRRGHSKSCGCLQRELAKRRVTINEIGNRYGRWTVIRQVKKDEGGTAKWLCRCDCGTEQAVNGTDLRNGHSKSCGCLARELNSLPKGEAAFNHTRARIRRNAKERGLEWALTKDQVRVLIKQDCHYCGAKPQQGQDAKRFNGAFPHNGLDRVDNEKGYIFGNVVPCCLYCNVAKRERTLEDFVAWAHQLSNHLTCI